MQSVLQDLRYGIRTLAKTPGVALLIIVTLSLGIGSSTLLFNMVRQWLFNAVTFPHSEQLTVVWEIDTEKGWENVRIRAGFHRLARAEHRLRKSHRLDHSEFQSHRQGTSRKNSRRARQREFLPDAALRTGDGTHVPSGRRTNRQRPRRHPRLRALARSFQCGSQRNRKTKSRWTEKPTPSSASCPKISIFR